MIAIFDYQNTFHEQNISEQYYFTSISILNILLIFIIISLIII